MARRLLVTAIAVLTVLAAYSSGAQAKEPDLALEFAKKAWKIIVGGPATPMPPPETVLDKYPALLILARHYAKTGDIAPDEIDKNINALIRLKNRYRPAKQLPSDHPMNSDIALPNEEGLIIEASLNYEGLVYAAAFGNEFEPALTISTKSGTPHYAHNARHSWRDDVVEHIRGCLRIFKGRNLSSELFSQEVLEDLKDCSDNDPSMLALASVTLVDGRYLVFQPVPKYMKSDDISSMKLDIEKYAEALGHMLFADEAFLWSGSNATAGLMKEKARELAQAPEVPTLGRRTGFDLSEDRKIHMKACAWARAAHNLSKQRPFDAPSHVSCAPIPAS